MTRPKYCSVRRAQASRTWLGRRSDLPKLQTHWSPINWTGAAASVLGYLRTLSDQTSSNIHHHRDSWACSPLLEGCTDVAMPEITLKMVLGRSQALKVYFLLLHVAGVP